jgi:predicted nucleic acid-binding OB-fold protein
MSKIILSEQQRRMILIESVSNDIEETQKNSEKLSEKIYTEIKGQLSFDFKILLTWSTAIGGFLTPLTQLIKGENPELSEMDSYLILCGVVFTVLFQNKENFKLIKDELVKRGIYETFLHIKDKALDLKKSFFSFLSGLNITTHTMAGIVAYSFLIPIVPVLMQLSSGDSLSPEDIAEIVKRVSAWGLTIVSANTLKNVITKIISKFN